MTGLGTTSTGWVSTFRLSHFRGRVRTASSVLTANMGLRPRNFMKMSQSYAQ